MKSIFDVSQKAFFHKTKIICTVGPAIATKEKIIQLIRVGADAFRLNMSHGSHETHAESVRIIRSAEEETGCFIPIIADVQGPKIRVGDLEGGGVVTLSTGREAFFADETVWKRRNQPLEIIPVRYPTIAKDVKKGDQILFDDGLLKVQVVAVENGVVRTLVINGGLLKSRKGINLPHIKVSQPSLTQKDKKDIHFALAQHCDFVAISFVRTAADIESAKKIIRQHNGSLLVIAKVEKPEAIANIKEIVEASDAIMVARGDLGVELSAAEVPHYQKQIIRLCNEKVKPVITATQMIESMVHNPRPTRAEASDVANAVLDGTDAVMLSAETSVGAYPVETVAYMRTICIEAEKNLSFMPSRNIGKPQKDSVEARVESVARAVATITDEIELHGIATLSLSGNTVKYISNTRVPVPIISMVETAETARRVNLFWGVRALMMSAPVKTTDEAIEEMKRTILHNRFLPANSTLAITIGHPLVPRSRTNMICIEKLG